MSDRPYTCAMCGGRFVAEWTDEEAVAELRRDFGDVSLEECDQVCDDCYQQISPQNQPEAYVDYITAITKNPIRVSEVLPNPIPLEDAEAIEVYVDAELRRRLTEARDKWEVSQLLGH